MTGRAQVRVVADPARACADALLQAVRTGGHVVLTGGSTPKAAYEMAAREASAFAGARLWFGDERCVGPEDDRSNFRMARESLLEPVAGAGVQIGFCHRMEGELGPDAGAAAYERVLRDEGAPPFELVLLGIGPDGHTASLFPGQETLEERERLVIGVPEAGFEPFVPRISFTFPTIGSARHVIVLASGSGKADAVGRAFGEGARPSRDTPASMLPEFVENLTLLLDEPAAGRLG
jgi:6-phosphogluconolactonase